MKEKVTKEIKKIRKFLNKINNKYEETLFNGKLKYIFQFFPKNIFLLIFFILLLTIFVPKVTNNEVLTYNSVQEQKVEKLENNKPVSCTISGKVLNNSKYVAIELLSFSNNNKYKVKMYENDKEIYAKNSITNKETSIYNERINTKKININKQSKYKIEINPKKVGDLEAIKDIKTDCIKVKVMKVSPFSNIVMVLSIIFFIIFMFINYLINNNKIKNEHKFLILTLLYIIPVLFMIPAYEVPDEPYHFYQSFGISTYKFDKKIGDHITDKNYKMFSNERCLDYSNISKLDNVYSKSAISKCFKDTNKIETFKYRTDNNNLLYYLTPGIALKLISSITTSPMIVFFFGRVVCLIISFLILLKAIKTTPKYKNIFIVLGCIPIFVQQMISYSYDGLLNAVALLSLAYFIKFYTSKEKIDRKEMIIYILTACVLLYLKRVYFVLVGLLLLIPNKKFKNGLKEKIIFIAGSILIPAVVLVLSNIIFSSTTPQVKKYLPGVNPDQQISYLINNPTQLPKVIYHTLNMSINNYLIETIGAMGWLNNIISSVVIVSFYIMFILVILSNDAIIKKLNERIYIMLLILLALGMVFMAMYTQWTPVGAYKAEGIQGRYILPLLLPLFMILMPKKKKLKISNNTIYTYANMMLLVLIVFILTSYY